MRLRGELELKAIDERTSVEDALERLRELERPPFGLVRVEAREDVARNLLFTFLNRGLQRGEQRNELRFDGLGTQIEGHRRRVDDDRPAKTTGKIREVGSGRRAREREQRRHRNECAREEHA